MRLIQLYFICFIILLCSCTHTDQQNQSNVYFDVLGLINNQINDFSSTKPLVRKKVWLDTATDTLWQSSHYINWSREFELFTQADINKMALHNSYQIIRPDSLTYLYIPKKSEDYLAVRSLTIRLDSITQHPRQLEAILESTNPLYSSERHLVMDLTKGTEQNWYVNHYKVAGYQKLAFFGKNQFGVEGFITYQPNKSALSNH